MDFTGDGKTQNNSGTVSLPSKQDAQFVPMEEEVGKNNEEGPQPQLVSNPEAEEDDNCYLSGKPYFDVILSKTSVYSPFQLYIPVSMAKLLPQVNVPVVLRHGGKNWNMSYIGSPTCPRFDLKWKAFVVDNHLKLGDACVFELMENNITNLRFKVHILRHDDFSPELMELIDSRGKTPETAICLN